MINEVPKVSVCVISYNHETYIEECLNSILSQRTDFAFEVVIGEDCSSDRTRKIIEEIALKHPQIRLLPSTFNLGALPNFIRSIKGCKGEYIAFCEGDDYWIDPLKLQKQIDFLNNHSEFGGVSTNNKWYFENEGTYKDSILDEGVISFEMLCKNNCINSQTILFRRSLLKNIDWMKDLNIGDWPLHLLISNSLPYFRLSDITTVYRVHQGGIHSLSNEEQKIRNRIEVLRACLNHLELTTERMMIIQSSLLQHIKRLMKYKVRDIKEIRKQYFEFGGGLLDKTLLKSYWNEVF